MTKNNLLAQRILAARKELGNEQKDLAAIIDMSRSTLSDKENGKTEITVNELFRFADGLKKPVSELLNLHESMTTNVANDCLVLSQNNHGTIYFQPSEEELKNFRKSKSKG